MDVTHAALRYFVPQTRKRNDVAYVVLTKWDYPGASRFCAEFLDGDLHEVVPDECFDSESEAERCALEVFSDQQVWLEGGPPGY